MNASQLKKLYSSYTPITDISTREYDNFYWFETDQGKIGLSREEVTKRELTFLLELFPKAHPEDSTREDAWKRLLFQKEEVEFAPRPERYRFIFFTAEHQMEDQDTLLEAFQALFPFPVPVLWKNSREGVLIEENSGSKEEDLSFQEVTEVLMSDFYMKIRFYVSEFFENFHEVEEQFSYAQQMADLASRHLPGTFARPLDTAFYLYMDSVKEENKEMLSSYMLGRTRSDHELLDTVKVFLENGANVSATAKELYMHRNSLQYRIDKFIDVTGKDIKHFPTGMLVYLSILHIRH